MSEQPAKDTIYVDAEDEITAIIEKVKMSPAKVVALVLPKRSATLQSVVNLKLLKRMAADAKKNLVLITSEANLLPLAGAVGLHVAKTLQSKPAIPLSPQMSDNAITIDDNTATTPIADETLDPTATVGQLAGQLATEETIELDNEATAEAPAKVVTGKVKLNKKLKVPDFDRFRLILFGGIALLLLLIVGSYFATSVLPRAKITIKTDTSSIATDLKLTATTEAKTVDAEKGIVPGISKTLKKTDSEKVPATGQRDDGTKAKGTVTFSLNDCSLDQVTIPSGSTIVAGDFKFVTQADAVLKSVKIGSTCHNSDFPDFSKATVNVLAASAGDKYNLGARAYSAPGFPNVSAAGSNMTGGTSKITQVVAQQDIDTAKQKVLERINNAATAELKAQFTNDNALALVDTFASDNPIVASSPNVNDLASEVSVSVTATFTELGVKQDDLKQLIEADVKKHIDKSTQVIQDNGLSKAVVHLQDKVSPSESKFEIQTVAVAGPQLDAEGIKKQIAGKKKGATQSLILARPGIKDVNIKYSPFWVFSTPKKLNHITIIFEQNGGK